MKLFATLLVALLTGCAYITKDVRVGVAESAGWVARDILNGQMVSYNCKNGDRVVVSFEKNLASEGSAYLLLFIVPISQAAFSDQEYEGLRIFVEHSSNNIACTKEDVRLGHRGIGYSPVGVTMLSGGNQACEYKWDLPLDDHGEFILEFYEIQQCKLPPLKLKYETKRHYNYDRLQG